MKHYGDHQQKLKPMALFDTLVPQINQFTAPTPAYTPPTPKYGWSQIAGDALGLGEGIGGALMLSNPVTAAAGAGLIAGGAGQIYNTNKQFLREGTGFHGLPAGSHESGNDLTLVHSKTGAPTNIKMEGDEILVGSDNSKALRDAISKKDKKAVYAIMLAQMSEKPKKYDGEVKLYEGTGANGVSTYNPNQTFNYSDPSTWGMLNGNWGGVQQSNTDYSQLSVANDQLGTGQSVNLSPNYYSAMVGESNPMGTTNPNVNTSLSSSGLPSATQTPNKWGYLASALPGALQTIYGLSQMHQTLPTFTEPQSYKNYLGQLQQMSTRGYTPEEQNYINRNIQGTYGIGLNNVKQNSGGNSAAVLGSLNNLGNAMNEAKLKASAEGANLQRQNLLNYGQGLTQEAQLYNLPQQEWLMKNYLAKQQMANQFVDSGLGNLEGSYLNYLHATDPNRGMFNNEVKRISQ